MKKILTLLALFFGLILLAQAPNKMSYQAVIRDASNNLLANTSIGTKVSILQGSSTGSVVYSETHTTSTNTNGLVTLEIGSGTVVSGVFSSIDWSTGNYYIKTETDPTGGTNYTISGTSQLLSVPYAMYASTSGSGSTADNLGNHIATQNINLGSNYISNGTSSNGLTLDAYGNPTFSSTITGFALITLDGSSASNTRISLKSSSDSWNLNGQNNKFYIHSQTADNQPFVIDSPTASNLVYLKKSNVGIGTSAPTEKLEVNGKTKTTNFQMTNGATNGYILQSDASGNASWVNSTTLSNGNWTTSGINQYNALSGNIGIGTSSPSNKLHVVGSQTLDAGRLVVQNTGNSIFIGENTGINDDFSDTNNIGIGYSCLTANVSGIDNVAIGRHSLFNNLSDRNIAIGRQSLYANTSGTYNTGLGILALNSNTTGAHNVGLGYGALYKNTTGEKNVALGNYAGINNLTGIGNVFLGYSSGYNETGSNKLYIDNSTTSTPLIWGDFSNDYVNINGNLGIGTSTPSNKLDIQSTSSVTANVQSSGSSAYYQADAPSGQEAAFLFNAYSSGSNLKRWAFGKSTAVESSSNAGSNFFINRYDDTGNYLGQPLAITRSTGQVVIGQSQPDSTESTLKLNGSMQVKVLTIASNNNATTLNGDDYMVVYNGAFSGNSITLPSASSYSGRIYMIVNHSSNSVSISSYVTANSTTSTSIAAGSTVQLVSDGTYWHKIN